jgi:hypothetical protein
MITLHGTLRLRPTRIGFLVSPTNLEAIRQVMRVCSCLWGGVYNPIIPVCDELPKEWQGHPSSNLSGATLADGYIKFFEPDVFVECESGLAAKVGLENAKIGFLKPRVVPLNLFFEESQTEGPKIPFGLSMFDVYEALYDREFKFLPRHDNRVGLFETGTPDDPFIEAVFGGFPREGFLSQIQQAYIEALNPQQLSPTPENWVKVLKEDYRMPVRFTAHGMQRENGWGDDPTLFVIDPQNSSDLIDLWNIRQFRSYVLPVNIEWANPLQEFLREFIIENHRPLRGNPHGVMVSTTVQFARSISEERAENLTKQLFNDLPQGSWYKKFWYDQIWRTFQQENYYSRPSRAHITAISANLELPVSTERNDLFVRFTSLSPEFASSYGDDAARWVNVLRPSNYSKEESVAVLLPSNFENMQCPRLRLGDGAIISREGWVLPQQYKNHGEYLTLMTGRQAIIEWLALHGVGAKPSDPGRIAEQILNAVGGLWRANLLAEKETLQLLDQMAKSTRKYSDGRVEEFPDRSIPVDKWISLIARRKNQQRIPRLSLDNFVKANILRLGLSIECPNCMKKNWCGLHDLDEQLTCERCLKTYDFPQGSLDFYRTPWEYRVVGPFTVPNYAGGAYATVLSLRLFSENLGSNSRLTYSTNLDIIIDKGNPQEIDFAFWYQRDFLLEKEEEPALVFGEAKSFGAESFKSEDAERLKNLAVKFPGAFLVFAVLKETLSDAEKDIIGELALWGRTPLADGRPQAPVIVLTGTELFSEWHIKQEWEKNEDKRGQFAEFAALRFDNLWTLADLTQQIYLGLPDKYDHLRVEKSPKDKT